MFKVMTDTSANLPSELLAENDIEVISFPYFVDGQERHCEDTAGFDGPAFYQSMREGSSVTTAQLNVSQYRSFMERVLKKGFDILFVGMSSGISGSFDRASKAAEELSAEYPERKIRLIDSLGASLGEGLLALKAAVEMRCGKAIDEVYSHLLKLRNRLCNIFTVENLKYLKNTGRLSNVASFVGNLLHIKPLLKGDPNGRIVGFAKVLGRKKSLEALAEKYNQYVENPEEQTVGIAHADCPEDAGKLAEMINASKPPKEILTVCYEPVTGSHVGPGTIALFFEAKEGCREM